MGILEWAPQETPDVGLERAVLYSRGVAVPWRGLISIEQRSTAGIVTDHYKDGVRQAITEESGDYEAVISAYMYPPEFERHDAFSDDAVETFDICWRELKNSGYTLHLVYNARVKPNDRTWTTLARAESPSTFVWNLTATPTAVPGGRPSAHLAIDSVGYLGLIADVEAILYGSDTTDPRMPTPSEMVDLFEAAAVLRVRVNDNGTWTAEGPADMVKLNADGTFTIDSPTAFRTGNDSFIVRSH